MSHFPLFPEVFHTFSRNQQELWPEDSREKKCWMQLSSRYVEGGEVHKKSHERLDNFIHYGEHNSMWLKSWTATWRYSRHSRNSEALASFFKRKIPTMLHIMKSVQIFNKWECVHDNSACFSTKTCLYIILITHG